MSKDLNNSNNNRAKGPLRDFLSKSNARSEKAMKAPIKKNDLESVWQEEDSNEDSMPSVEVLKNIVDRELNRVSRQEQTFAHIMLTCTYCEQNPCECHGKGHDV